MSDPTHDPKQTADDKNEIPERRESASPVCYSHLFEDSAEAPASGPADAAARAGQVRHVPDAGRFATDDGAVLSYQIESPDRFVVTHTFVPETLRGQGHAARLTEAALEYARKTALTVVPQCCYTAAYLKRKTK